MVALNEATGKPGMSPISVLLNLLWIAFGGLWMAAGWLIAALIMAITIIGIPWARAAFNIAARAHGIPMMVMAMISADRKSTRLNSSHMSTSYSVICLKKNN